ncbi:MAG: tetratricopeptide repeat protein, partial [Bdellovibrionaceae bacterium]|nr:tetratricopeptide repeat protein [Pseudobdellovibrionaceae bacterium]MDW8189582.1 tetratricopeptide repeat protein [Pseudobdellovibrionaceae bacterium]
EFYFEKNEFSKALDLYDQVTRGPYQRLAWYSLYKKAWCLFKLGRFKEAIVHLEKIIIQNKKRDKETLQLQLDVEARRDLVLFYSEAGDPKLAIKYFLSLLGKDEGLLFLEKLAYRYFDRGDVNSSRIIFEFLIAERPHHPKSFDYQFQIVRMYSTTKDINFFMGQLFKWISNYGPNSQWAKSNQGNIELLKRSNEILERSLRVWTLTQHQSAQNSRGELSQKLAENGYRLYFQFFAQSPYAAEMRFFFAELLFDLDKKDQAAAQYRMLLDMDKNSKYALAAASNLVFLSEQMLPKEKQLQEKLGNSVDPIPMDKNVVNYIESGRYFLSLFGNEAKAPEIKFRIGRLYYLHNHFDQAIPYFRDILKNHPKSKYTEYSATLLLDSLSLKNDVEELRRSARDILNDPNLRSLGFAPQIEEVLRKADFKKAQDLEEERKYKESAETYQKFAMENPQNELAGVAFYNAAIGFQKVGINSLAIANLKRVIQRQDAKSIELRAKSYGLLALLYQDSGQLENSAECFEKAAHFSKSPSESAIHYSNAGVLFELLGMPSRAIANFKNSFEKSKSPENASVLFTIGKLYQGLGDLNQSNHYFEKFLKESAVSGLKKIQAYYELMINDVSTKSKESWRKLIFAEFDKLPVGEKAEAKVYLAKTQLEFAKIRYEDLWKTRINNPNRMKQQLEWKLEILEKINKLVSQIVAYESFDEVIAAIKILGDANLNMYESIMKSPTPKELTSEDSIQEYRQKLKKELADPFLQKAIESYELVLKKSNTHESYSSITLMAREQLIKLGVNAYLDLGEKIFERYLPIWQ